MIGTENERANVSLGATINFFYGVFVAARLSGARNVTVFGIVVGDFLLQLRMTYQIVQLHKKIANHEDKNLKKEKRKVIINLVLSEMCEGLVPLAYAICFAIRF